MKNKEVWWVGVLIDLNEPHGDLLETENSLITFFLSKLILSGVIPEATRLADGTQVEIYRKPGQDATIICLCNGKRTGMGVQVESEAEGYALRPAIERWFDDARLSITPSLFGIWTWSSVPVAS